MIADAAEREIDSWPLRRPFALAPRMQAITLDVIMAGIFGIETNPAPSSPEGRRAIRRFLIASTRPIAQCAELANLGRTEPRALMRPGLALLDRPTFAVIAARRRSPDIGERRDILSLLLRTETEEGEMLSDKEIRDELLALVFAGHDTTANTMAWTWERLLRILNAHEALLGAVRSDDRAKQQVEATIAESMRSRPVIPLTGRRVTVPWRSGSYVVPAGAAIGIGILLLHHREDLYPRPFAFRPER